MELTVIATAKAKPGKEKDLERELRAVVAPTHQEEGCLLYHLHRSLEEPALLAVVERWASKRDLDRHLVSAHVQTLFKNVGDLVAGAPQILVLESLAAGSPQKEFGTARVQAT